MIISCLSNMQFCEDNVGICMLFFFFFLSWKSGKKNPIYMIISLLSNMQFCEDNVGICMLSFLGWENWKKKMLHVDFLCFE